MHDVGNAIKLIITNYVCVANVCVDNLILIVLLSMKKY